METDTALEEGIKEGYRRLREATYTVMTADEASNEAVGATGAIFALLPVMEALTGRSKGALLDASLRRLVNDGRLTEPQ